MARRRRRVSNRRFGKTAMRTRKANRTKTSRGGYRF